MGFIPLPLLFFIAPLLTFYLYHRLQKARSLYDGLPAPPSSLLWGHMKFLHGYLTHGHPDRHFDYIINDIRRDLGNPPFVFMDFRPLNYPMLTICSYEFAEQISRATSARPYSVTKSPTVADLQDILGGLSIILSEGERWKEMRKRYNPGFQPRYLQSLLPGILKHVNTFVQRLEAAAKKQEVVTMAVVLTNLTFDIIGKVVLDYDMNAQSEVVSEKSRVFLSLVDTLAWYRETENPVEFFNFVPGVMKWWHSRKTDKALREVIREKFEQIKREKEGGGGSEKSIISMTLKDVDELSPLQMEKTIHQVKSFLFAGHETTSVSIQWTLYQLTLPQNSHLLTRLRAEHDTVFGSSPTNRASRASQILISTPEKALNSLPLTTAVFKEALRLWPPASTARMNHSRDKNPLFVEWEGKRVNVDDHIIYNCSFAIHRDPLVWGADAHVFRPDRWLDGSMSAVPEGAWRPFERGPRNCIGQELSIIEAKIILIMIIRTFDFKKIGYDGVTEPEVYNIRQIISKPVDGMRMKVSMASD